MNLKWNKMCEVVPAYQQWIVVYSPIKDKFKELGASLSIQQWYRDKYYENQDLKELNKQVHELRSISCGCWEYWWCDYEEWLVVNKPPVTITNIEPITIPLKRYPRLPTSFPVSMKKRKKKNQLHEEGPGSGL